MQAGPRPLGILAVGLALSLGAPLAHVAAPARSGPDAVCGLPDVDVDVLAEEIAALGREHACEHAHARLGTGDPHGEVGDGGPGAAGPAAATFTRAALTTTDPATVGSWSAPVNPGTVTIGITSVVLHTGKVLMFGGKYSGGGVGSAASLYDPVSRTGRRKPSTP